MSRVRPSAVKVQHGARLDAGLGRQIPLLTVIYLFISGAVTVGAHQFPEAAGPLSLGLATFLTMDRVTRQIR